MARFSEASIKQVLRNVAKRKTTVDEAYARLQHFPYENVSFARIDHHRHMRTSIPEVIYAPGKTIVQMKAIARCMKRSAVPLIVTRLTKEAGKKLKRVCPFLSYRNESGIAYWVPESYRRKKSESIIAVVTAGTSDIPVAEEARTTIEIMGRQVLCAYDCGVAGIHRLMDILPDIRKADVIICIAGMEGALASVVAGLVECPVIAVPTSVGYGAHFEGLAALLSMMNACAPGITVVNIDNGFGAACAALLMTKNK